MRKIVMLVIMAGILISTHIQLQAEEVKMEKINILKEIPYRDGGMGKRKLVDEDYLLVMQAALKPGQMVPQHNADSNVRILVIKGNVVVDLDEEKINASEGDIVPATPGTPMNIVNRSEENATFLIIKTPHPRMMKLHSGCGMK